MAQRRGEAQDGAGERSAGNAISARPGGSGRTKGAVRTPSAPTMTEKMLQGAVVNLAKLLGWRCYHTFLSIRSTPGFPDCCLVRGERLVFAELKSELGKVSQAQTEWLDALEQVPGVEVFVWWPTDWLSGRIEEILR